MKRRMWMAFAGLVVLLAACAPATLSTLVPPAESTPPPGDAPAGGLGSRPGSPAPDFALKTLNGDVVSLSSYTGRPVFINFWASWCGPCRAEMPEIIAAYKAHKGAGLEVLAINLTFQDAVEDAQAFVDEFQMPFPVLLDEDGRVSKAYSLFGLPTSVFIDADGIVRAVNAGPMTGEVIEQHLAAILPAR